MRKSRSVKAMNGSRVLFGPFGREAVCPYGLELYSGTTVQSDATKEIEELRAHRSRAGSYRIRGVELRYRGDSTFTTCFGAPVDDETVQSSALTCAPDEFFNHVSLGFYIGHLCSFAATTNCNRCVVLHCGHLEQFGVIESFHVHNNGGRLRGLRGRCCHQFICSLSLCFDNSWKARGPLLLLRRRLSSSAYPGPSDEAAAALGGGSFHEEGHDLLDDDDDARGTSSPNCPGESDLLVLLPRMFALPDVVQRIILLFL